MIGFEENLGGGTVIHWQWVWDAEVSGAHSMGGSTGEPDIYGSD